ncbi:MAG: hypothetical protein OXB98_15170 [Bryobacterales bacterium]|nr:hypothetical protein [Bryobacterales bacterium]
MTKHLPDVSFLYLIVISSVQSAFFLIVAQRACDPLMERGQAGQKISPHEIQEEVDEAFRYADLMMAKSDVHE